jgi:hypothetical protein
MTPSRIVSIFSVCACALIGVSASAQTLSSVPDAKQVFDKTLSSTEQEFVSLVAAMPADKFGFAPTAGKFDGVRTFGEQAKHVAFVLNEISAALLGEKAPETTPHENGPANVTGKDQILQYVKDAFAHAHKANLLEQTADPFDPKAKRTRVDSVGIMSWHTFDHYGQMVEYARMNNVVPPASQ